MQPHSFVIIAAAVRVKLGTRNDSGRRAGTFFEFTKHTFLGKLPRSSLTILGGVYVIFLQKEWESWERPNNKWLWVWVYDDSILRDLTYIYRRCTCKKPLKPKPAAVATFFQNSNSIQEFSSLVHLPWEPCREVFLYFRVFRVYVFLFSRERLWSVSSNATGSDSECFSETLYRRPQLKFCLFYWAR